MDNEKVGLQCPEGYDYNALRVFLRDPQRSGIPKHLRDHFESCITCKEKWDFLERTDAIVQQQFQRQVNGLIMQVRAREIILPTRITAPHPSGKKLGTLWVPGFAAAIPTKMAAWVSDLAKTMPRIPGTSTARAVSQASVLAAALAVSWPDPALVQRLRTLEPLPVGETIDICDRTRSISDANRRLQQATAMASLFNQRVDRRHLGLDLLEKLYNWPDSEVDLSDTRRLGVDSEIATEVVASIPATSYCQNPVLLKFSGSKPVFYSKELLALTEKGGC